MWNVQAISRGYPETSRLISLCIISRTEFTIPTPYLAPADPFPLLCFRIILFDYFCRAADSYAAWWDVFCHNRIAAHYRMLATRDVGHNTHTLSQPDFIFDNHRPGTKKRLIHDRSINILESMEMIANVNAVSKYNIFPNCHPTTCVYVSLSANVCSVTYSRRGWYSIP